MLEHIANLNASGPIYSNVSINKTIEISVSLTKFAVHKMRHKMFEFILKYIPDSRAVLGSTI